MGGYQKDLTGMRFGRLTVIDKASPAKGSHGENLSRWNCICDCGNKRIVRALVLLNGRTLSCGCLGKEHRRAAVLKHGLSKQRIYHIYLGMIDRCYDQNSENYFCYGGRGISVCDEWRGENGATLFKEWAMKNGYAEDLSLDRIDVDGNYEPSNCRWVDNYVQQNNKRDNRYITINGVTKTMKEWSREVGIGYTTLKQRIYHGWNPVDAVLTPVDKRFSHP